MLSALGLLLSTAQAASFDIVTDDAVLRAISGECVEVESRLQSRVDRDPADLAARLAIDGCRVGTTAEAEAAADLAGLYQVSAPFDPGVLLKRKDATPADLSRLRVEAQRAAAFVIRRLSDKGYWEDAQRAIQELEERVGRSGPTVAARIAVERAQNGAPATWRIANAALSAFPDDVDVLEEVGLMVFDDGAGAAKDILDAVLVRARSTAKLNALYGLARAGRGAECVLRVATVSVPEDYEEKLRAVNYKCAVAARDLASADAIVKQGQRQLDARTRAEHGALLVDAGRPADAMKLVRDIATADAKATETAFRALSALGETGEMVELARQLPPDSVARLTAAVTMFNAREFDVALTLLDGNCERYVGQNAVLCTRVVDGSRRAAGR